MLKLTYCEFLKLKRKGAYKLALFTSVLFPLFNAALLSDGNLEDIMSGVREESGFLLLIPVLVIMAASLFFEEHDNDTLKNLLCIPVSKRRLVMAKVFLLFLFSVFYELAGFAISISLALSQGIAINGWSLELFLTFCTGILLWAVALPCIILVIWCNKSYIISVIIAFFYTLLGYALHLSDTIMMKPLGPNFATFIPVPMIFRWLYQFKVPQGKIMTDFYNRLSPYFVSTPIIFMILFAEAAVCVFIVIRIYQKQEKETVMIKDNILSKIAFLTIFVPLTVVFVWKPTSPFATATIIGYCIFAALSFIYALFLFTKMRLRDNYTKIALGVNGVYVLGIIITVIIPPLL